MKATFVLSIGLAAALIGVAAQAETPRRHAPPHRPVPNTRQSIVSPPIIPAPAPAPTPSLFTIGNLPARLWAPVPPAYDARANHTNAGNPLWWNDGVM